MSFLNTLRNSRWFKLLLLALVCFAWIALHLPGMLYGTWQLPLHMSYVGDEQAPVTGALHILSEKSILGVRTTNNYYGPLFATIALPGVLTDFGIKYISGIVHTPDEYKNYILFDWGGIVTQIRLMAVIWSLIGLFFIYNIFTTKTLNSKQHKLLPWIAVLLIASNFYFFEYSHFFKHWIFIIVTLFAQVYFLIRIEEEEHATKRSWLWVFQALAFVIGFGISYINIAFQILWLPIIIRWIHRKSWGRLKGFGLHLIYCAAGAGLMVLWHPYAFFRIAAGNAFVRLGLEAQSSLQYYSGLVFQNHIALFVAILVLVVWLWKKEKLYSQPLFWAFLLPAVANFVVFSIPVRYEGRYMLPTIVLTLLLTGYLLSLYVEQKNRNRIVTVALIALLSFNTVFHIVHDAKWISIFNNGPREQALVQDILYIQNRQPGAKTLVIQDYIIGHTHTRGAYLDYMGQSKKTDVNLYNELLKSKYPTSVLPLNVYYFLPQNMSKYDQRIYFINPGILPIRQFANQYDHMVLKYKPRLEPNQFDFFDNNLLRLWSYQEQSDVYFFLK